MNIEELLDKNQNLQAELESSKSLAKSLSAEKDVELGRLGLQLDSSRQKLLEESSTVAALNLVLNTIFETLKKKKLADTELLNSPKTVEQFLNGVKISALSSRVVDVLNKSLQIVESGESPPEVTADLYKSVLSVRKELRK